MVKNQPTNAGDVGLISGPGRSPKKEMATHSSENPMGRGACHAILLGVTKESEVT